MQQDEDNYLLNSLDKVFYFTVKFLDFYSMHRFYFCCKKIMSSVSLENEYKNLCKQNFTNVEEKIKGYGNSYKRLLIEYPRIRHDGVYVSCTTYIRPLKDIGNIHLDPKDKNTTVYNPCIVTYFRYFLFLSESNKVIILRSEISKQEVLTVLQLIYKEIKKWDLSISCDEFIKHLIKFQNESDNHIVKFIKIGEYTYNAAEKTIVIKYPELLNEPDKYRNLLELRLNNYLGRNNNMMKWISFKILSKASVYGDSEDTLNINNKQYRPFFFFNLKFLSHLFITRIQET